MWFVHRRRPLPSQHTDSSWHPVPRDSLKVGEKKENREGKGGATGTDKKQEPDKYIRSDTKCGSNQTTCQTRSPSRTKLEGGGAWVAQCAKASGVVIPGCYEGSVRTVNCVNLANHRPVPQGIKICYMFV